jgi:hypothetical protein
MFMQLIAVLQLAGIFAAFLGAYLMMLEYLMPTPHQTINHVTDK